MKYLLINQQTGEETLCNKVKIDGFDYYVGDEQLNYSNYENFSFWFYNPYIKELQINCNPNSCHKVIATNNQNIDLPKVIDEVEKFASEFAFCYPGSQSGKEYDSKAMGYYYGYKKSQETHPFSEEDMIDFERFCNRHDYENGFGKTDRKELLQLWKYRQQQKIYYTQTPAK